MNGFLSELGKKLADRWLELLVLPGLLWIGTLGLGVRLGQRHPFKVTQLYIGLNQLAADPASRNLATALLAATGLLLAAAAAGLIASALGGLLQRLWALPGHHRPLTWLLKWRRHRWDTATEALRSAIAAAGNPALQGLDPVRTYDRARRASTRRAAVAATRPARPTWIGDRLHATATRINSAYGLDLDLVWPRLWTVLPDTLRADLGAAMDAYIAAARLVAWGLLYTILTVIWWPAVLAGTIVIGIGWSRARLTTGTLTDLIETAVDLHTLDLAERLRIPAPSPATVDTGRAITQYLRKAP